MVFVCPSSDDAAGDFSYVLAGASAGSEVALFESAADHVDGANLGRAGGLVEFVTPAQVRTAVLAAVADGRLTVAQAERVLE